MVAIQRLEDCRSPFLVKNQNGMRHFIPCGKCIPCLKKKANEWSTRLHHEFKSAVSGYFVTLTYDTENLPIVNSWDVYEAVRASKERIGSKALEKLKQKHLTRANLCVSEDLEVILENRAGVPSHEISLNKRDLQLFIERLAKRELRYSGNKVRYYACGEEGERNGRPHYHLILMNVSKEIISKLGELWVNPYGSPMGHFHVGEVTDKSIGYCTKYMVKPYDDFELSYRVRPFHLMSRGLGLNYITDAKKKYHNEGKKYFVNKGKFKVPMPRYYKSKIFPELNEGQKNWYDMKRKNDSLREYWKEYADLKAKGIHDPDEYMEREKLHMDVLITKRNYRK